MWCGRMNGIRIGVAMTLSDFETSNMHHMAEAGLKIVELGLETSVPLDLPQQIREKLDRHMLTPTFHLPFRINLLNADQMEQSKRLLQRGIRLADRYTSIAVFHGGWYGNCTPELAVERAASLLRATLHGEEAAGILGIETTGKKEELGTLDEVFRIASCVDSSKLIPVVDWAHLYARSFGRFPITEEDFKQILDRMDRTGTGSPLHFHVAGMSHKNGSERKHLSVQTCLPPIPYLLRALEEQGHSANLVLETPSPLEDLRWIMKVRDDIPAACRAAAAMVEKETGYTQSLLDFYS